MKKRINLKILYLLTITPAISFLPLFSLWESMFGMQHDDAKNFSKNPTTVEEIKKIPFEERIKLPILDNTKSGAMTSVKNQGSTLICWAYALAAASETNILYQPEVFGNDFSYNKENLNFSPENIDIVTNRRNGKDADPLGLTSDDNFWKGINGSSALINFFPPQMFFQGNSPIVSKNTIANKWDKSGPVVARIKDVIQIPNNQNWYSNVDEIKKAVAQYGAVVFNYKAAPGQVAYYQDTYNMSHASTIVGWDDTFSKEHFRDKDGNKKTPSRNGAWIVKNSYGPDIYNYQGQTQGYFYLSYDSRIEDPIAVNFGKLYDGTNNKYYYNGTGQSSLIHNLNGNTSKSVANIFPVKKASNDRIEILKSASVAMQIEPNAEIIMKVYANVNANLNGNNVKNNNPENGILVYEKKEKILPYDAQNLPPTSNVKNKYNVTHTVEIDKEIELRPNTNYSIVFEFANEKGNEFLQSENGNEYDPSYVKINGKWELFGNYESIGVPVVSTINATTIDKPRETINNEPNLFDANIIANKQYVYDGSNNINITKDDINVTVNNIQIPKEEFDIQSRVVIDPNQTKAGYIQISVLGKNKYKGYKQITIDIEKSDQPKLIDFSENIKFDNNNKTFNVDLNVNYSTNDIHNLINLPNGWKYENNKIIYSKPDKDCYKNTEFSVKINPIYQQEQISNVEIKIIGEYQYTGNPIIPEYEIWYNNEKLSSNHYEVKFENNINASNDAKIIVNGIGNFFKGRKELSFQIKKALNDININDNNPNAIYGDLTIAYYKDKECTQKLEQKPISGNYYIKVSSNDSNNYIGVSKVFEISQPQPELKPEVEQKPVEKPQPPKPEIDQKPIEKPNEIPNNNNNNQNLEPESNITPSDENMINKKEHMTQKNMIIAITIPTIIIAIIILVSISLLVKRKIKK